MDSATAMTPVETIARAMQADAGQPADELYWTTPCTGAVVWRSLAQAALSALLTPSESMVEAGMEQGPIGCCNASDKDIREIWQAMIQAAIQESTP